MAVWDQEMVNSDLVGETTIKLTALAANGGIDEWYSIQYKGKKSGDVHIKSTWKPTGGELSEKPAQTDNAPTLTYANGQAAQDQMAAQFQYLQMQQQNLNWQAQAQAQAAQMQQQQMAQQ